LEGYEVAKNQSDKRSSGSHSLIAVVCSDRWFLNGGFFVSMLAMYEYSDLDKCSYRPVRLWDIFRVPLFCFFPGVKC